MSRMYTLKQRAESIILISFLCVMISSCNYKISDNRKSAMELLTCASFIQNNGEAIPRECRNYIVVVNSNYIVLENEKKSQKLIKKFDEKNKIWNCKGSPKKDFPFNCR